MILVCFGTRPEWLKIKPLITKIDCKTLFTGQHTDLLPELKFDYTITQTDRIHRLDSIMQNCLNCFPNDPDIDSVLVQGDTASAFACSVAAFNRGLKIIHLEAGLRTYDLVNPFPEEGYRQMISRIADINLCPTDLSAKNLLNEKVKGKTFVVGNTVLDNIVKYKSVCSYTNKILVTIHRRENHSIALKWFKNINEIAKNNKHLEFILPLHPNPNIQKHKEILTDVTITDPLSHEELINVLAHCKLVITDSGGLQEEGAFLNKKIIVCRQTTERPEGIETGHLYLCENANNLDQIFNELINNFYISAPCPYGDGHSSQKIKNILTCIS
jgi:UDP-N-acetylglucosamine 2-epimerase (non-hydrolysing)